MEKRFAIRVLIVLALSLAQYLVMKLTDTFTMALFLIIWLILNAVHLVMWSVRVKQKREYLSLARVLGLLVCIGLILLDITYLHWF